MSGISESGFEIKRLPEIKGDLEELVRVTLGSDATLLPDSIEGQLIIIFSEIFAELWEQLNEAYNAFNPIAVTGQQLDNLAFLNGVIRLAPTPSVVLLAIEGVDNTIVPAGSIIRHDATSVEFSTAVAVEIGVGFPTGTATMVATAKKDGAIEALAGTLNIIASPVNGWDTVINNNDAVVGRASETDAELRARRDRSFAISGSASLTTIVSGVARVAGVLHATGQENVQDAVDGFGIPAHAFEIIAEGGTDAAIGQVIWNEKPVGIEAHGDIPVGVIDIFGNNHVIKFSRPAPITLFLNATVTFLITAPSDAAEVLTQAVLDFVAGELISGEALGVGDDVIPSRLYLPFNVTYSDMVIDILEISTDGVGFQTTIQAIEFNELSKWLASRIVITVI